MSQRLAKELAMFIDSKRIAIPIVLMLSIFTMSCTSNDLDKYRDNGLIPGERARVSTVVQKAKIANKERDEESVGDALDEFAEFLITTSGIWLPIFLSSTSN